MIDDLLLKIDSRKVSGWQKIRVTKGIERCPNDFELEITEEYDRSQLNIVTAKPGDSCKVFLGTDLVLSGYINHYVPSFDAHSHTIRIWGRGKCQDLVDCSAEWPSGQIVGASALSIAQNLSKPYGITVSEVGNENGDNIAQLNLILTETAWEIIERTCRFRGMLAYEGSDGNLILSRRGTDKMSSGAIEGANVQRASYEISDENLYSEYRLYRLSVAPYLDGVSTGKDASDAVLISSIYSSEERRNRRLSVIAEAGTEQSGIALQRGIWERNRREGRSNKVRVTVDSWRDAADKLWEPNKIINVSLPSLKVQPDPAPWLISEVTFSRDEQGTRADLVIMPPDAFSVKPTILLPTYLEVAGKQ